MISTQKCHVFHLKIYSFSAFIVNWFMANCSWWMSPGLGLRKLQVCPMLVVVLVLKLWPFCTQVRGHLSHVATNLFNQYLLSFNLVQTHLPLPRNTNFGNKDSGSSPIPAIGKADGSPLCVRGARAWRPYSPEIQPWSERTDSHQTWVCVVGFPTQNCNYLISVNHWILHNSVLIPK